MILGFDNDDATVFDAQREFLREARITHAMIGMLTAIPKTPLYARLAREGRLDPDDVSEFGTNVIPLRMSRQALRDGYVQVLKDLYEPEAFFGRVDDLYLKHKSPFFAGMRRYHRRNPWRRFGRTRQGSEPGPRPFRPADAPRSRSRTAARVPPAPGPPAARTARPSSDLPLHGQVRDALPPLHDGPANGRRARDAREFLLSSNSKSIIGTSKTD